MVIDPGTWSSRDLYYLMVSCVVPRPIAFVSTRGVDGVTNLAPFSYFNLVSWRPPMLSICIGQRRWQGSFVKKDTLRNIEATRELVVNVATEPLIDQVNAASAELPPDRSEIDHVGLTAVDCDRVAAPRIAESPISLECVLDQVVMVGRPPQTGLVIAEVVWAHIADDVWNPDARAVDPERLRPLARLGGDLYAGIGAVRSLPRPR